MSDPTYTPPPPTLSTSAKVAKRGAYMQDTMVVAVTEEIDTHTPIFPVELIHHITTDL